MRLAHHITLIGTTYYFRLTTPPDLRRVLGKRYLKLSLRTSDAQHAKYLSYHMAAAYLKLFHNLRGELMANEIDVDELMRRLQSGELNGIQGFQLRAAYNQKGKPAGWAYEAEGEQDVQHAKEEVARLDRRGFLPPELQPLVVANQAAPTQSHEPSMLLSEAMAWFAKKFTGGLAKSGLSNESLERYGRFQEEFLKFLGDRPINQITRHEVDRYRQHLDGNVKNSAPTIKNKLSGVSRLFQELIAAGLCSQDNPATGHIKLSAKQKQKRSQAHGRGAFEDDDILVIFDPTSYEANKEPAEYWVPLIQLYTGCRVNEVCQLNVDNFRTLTGHPCILIIDTDEQQSVKEESSKRIIPIHDDLIELGLMDYVGAVKAQGHERLFPYLVKGKNRWGSRQMKAFVAYLKILKFSKDKRFGTHGFRKYVARKLQKAGIDKDLRVKYVGHAAPGESSSVNDVHSLIYESTKIIDPLIKIVLPALDSGIDLSGLKRDMMCFEPYLKKSWIDKQKKTTAHKQAGMAKRKKQTLVRPTIGRQSRLP